jgi:hypothetical protein
MDGTDIMHGAVSSSVVDEECRPEAEVKDDGKLIRKF